MSNKPPIEVPQGAIRLNTDSQKLEFFAQDRWYEMATNIQTLDGGARAIWGGGGPSPTTRIDYVTISTAGNAIDFGDMLGNRHYMRGYGNQTRGLWGHNVQQSSEISFITISSTGNAQDFGDFTAICQSGCWTGNSTRACAWEGQNPTTNVISFVTIASTGNAVDFGDHLHPVRHTCGVQSPTRGIIPGGWSNQPSQGNTNIIQYITTATLGNAQDFGDVTISESIRGHAAGCNAVRGVYGGGIKYPSGVQSGLEYITLATTGNGSSFGDLAYTGRQEGGGAASPVRAVFGGSYSPSALNTINYVQIATTGDAVDFGDLTIARGTGALSNGHGGL